MNQKYDINIINTVLNAYKYFLMIKSQIPDTDTISQYCQQQHKQNDITAFIVHDILCELKCVHYFFNQIVFDAQNILFDNFNGECRSLIPLK